MGRKKIQITRIVDERNRQALNKKEHRGCESPDADASYVLAPHTEEKYKKINEEFDNMMKSHQISTGPPQQNFMSYSPGAGGGGGGGGEATSQALAAATAALVDSGILSSPHTHLHRIMNPPQRPPSTGNTGGLQSSSDMALQNGSGPVVNGFVGSPGGGNLGKLIPPKSPSPLPPLGNNMVATSRKIDLRVVIPQSKGLMQTLSNQRQSQSSQPLSTPVVSINTPSLPHQSLVYCSISSAYDNDYSLSSAELSGFSCPAGPSLGSMAAWQQHQLGSLGCDSPHLSISTNRHVSIKAEPISPPRDHLSQSGYMTPRPNPHSSARAEMGRSPADSISSSCSSHEGGSDREEQQQQRLDFHMLPVGRSEGGESPTVKRMRMDNWVT
ncbi:myocyte-specific enhancer factor 2A-like isoform X2 [Pseudoliparis swirei]|uniref:myocyte-specific enhancer factor 2A-like isoform X2 n=1 Tax=Pseudoliparis swirei TaxID=2059687 RepID=UPI0024BE61B5|nr:myocyte-specific enhancer factor 2A-like isoform X2 [Pseudoliparis swirei]